MTDDWRENPSIVAMVDAALLSLIRGHGGGEDERTRLHAAKEALFDIKPPRGRPVDNDLAELLYMAEEYVKDRGSPNIGADYIPFWSDIDESNCRSKTALAREALTKRQLSDPAARTHNDEEKIRTLEQKFTSQRDGLLRFAVGWGASTHDEVVGWALRDVKQLIDLFEIPFVLPSIPSRDANSLD